MEYKIRRLTLEFPKTLHYRLETLACNEGVPLKQYIVFTLTRKVKTAYTLKRVPEKEIDKQHPDFALLFQNLGQKSFTTIEQIMREREVATPETGLTPEVVKLLQDRTEKQQPSA